MAATKVDFKRELREFYTAKPAPAIVEVPELVFLMVDGHGDPNTSAEYREAVSALFSVSYAARFALKRGDILEYGVMPLEGLWWVPDMSAFTTEDKSAWDWTMMIMQPDAVTREVFEAAMEKAAKRSLPALERVRLERFAEGPAAQVMHRGPYSAEGPTIAALHAFIADQGHELAGKHHEIYLSDPRRSAPERMKTILRQPVR
jgi:hypothetical protein